MKSPFDHISAAQQELEKWGVHLTLSSSLATAVQNRFGKWKYSDRFAQIVPHETTTVATVDREFLYLWGGDYIRQDIADYPDNDRFIIFGSLCDGSYLAIDAGRTNEMKIGAFPFEECSSPDGMILDDDLFVGFPFQYHEYLHYLHTAPEFDDFLFGYGR